VRDELKLGALARLHIPAMRTTVPVALVYRRNGYLGSAAQALIRLLSDTSLRLGERRRMG
jgi:hypothetical protein